MSDAVEEKIRKEGGQVGCAAQEVEFPRSRVILHEHVGEGAFGDVYKADAIGITDRPITTVAVKILKGN